MNHYSQIDLIRHIKEMKKHNNYELYGHMPHSILAEIADDTFITTLQPVSDIRKTK